MKYTTWPGATKWHRVDYQRGGLTITGCSEVRAKWAGRYSRTDEPTDTERCKRPGCRKGDRNG